MKTPVNSTEVGLNFSYPSSVDMNARCSTSETICLQCGNKGFTNAFVYCVKCLQFAVHRYCLDVIPNTVDGFARWICDDCDAEVQNQPVRAFECNMDGHFGGEQNLDFEDDNVQNVEQESNIDQAPTWSWKRHECKGLQPAINLYYKNKALEKIRVTLRAVGGEELYDRFKEGCFGHLMNWRGGISCSKALHELMAREISLPGAPDHEIWFNIGGKLICFSPTEYALVTGLMFGSSSFDPTSVHCTSRVGVYMRFCHGKPIRLAALMNKFTERDVADASHDDYVKVANILVLYFFALGYADRRTVDDFVWVLVDELEAWDRFPWGAYTYQALMHYVNLVPKTRDLCGKHYHFYGPVWALQIWAYEAIPELGHQAATLVDSTALPRCLRWYFSLVKMEFDRFFDQELEAYEMLPLEEQEEWMQWHLSVQTNRPLNVRYNSPRKLIFGQQSGAPVVRRVVKVARRVRDDNLSCGAGSLAGAAALQPRRSIHNVQDKHMPNPPEEALDFDHDKRDKGKRVRKEYSSSSSGGDRGRQYRNPFADPSFMEEHTNMIVRKLLPHLKKMVEGLWRDQGGHSAPPQSGTGADS